jgi:predicted phage tail protein
MTTIVIHGILGKLFRKTFKLHLGRMNDFVNAIDSICKGFRLKLKELSEKGYNYAYDYDEKTKELNVIPFIGGSGKTVLIIIACIIIVLAIFLAPLAIGGFAALFGSTGAAGAAAAAAGTLTIAAQLGTFVIGTLFMTGISMLIQGLMMETLKQPEAELKAVGGGTSVSAAAGRSFVFSGSRNIASQGTSVPVGYGKMKVGSRLISLSIKSFPTSLSFESASSSNSVNSINIYD